MYKQSEEEVMVELKEHLESACHAAYKLKSMGTISHEVYERDFNGAIAMIEMRIRDLIEEV